MIDSQIIDMAKFVLDYIGVPLAVFVWAIYKRVGDLHTRTTVLEERSEQVQGEMRRAVDMILAKLDGIEAALRK